MILERLSLANCGGFEQIDIDFEPDITVIAGVNGVGKSTVLHLLAILVSKTHRRLKLMSERPLKMDHTSVFSGATTAQAEATFIIDKHRFIANLAVNLEREKMEKFNLVGQSDGANHQNMLSVLFTPKRHLQGKPRKLVEPKTFNPSVAFSRSLEDREVELREFMHWFRAQEKLGTGNKQRTFVLDSLRRVVSDLVPEFSDLRIQEKPSLGFVVTKSGKPLYLHQLSDGERGLLALVFDLTRRLAIANPDSDDPISEGNALVLIDEIELHLHPKWQREVLGKLQTIFSNCQFVVTTHSPLVLGEVPARCVRFLEQGDSKTTVARPVEAYGLDANRILEELMGARIRNKDIESELRELFQMIDQEYFESAKGKIEDLKLHLGNYEPELTRASSLITFLEGSE